MTAIGIPRNFGFTLGRALALADGGVPCFPCRSDKRPATPKGFKDATSDREGVERLWRKYPGQLVGVPTGRASGFDVIDIDVRKGGDLWFLRHKQQLLPTRAHRTVSGGIHLLLLHLDGLRCSAGKIAAGVDVRADGGYVIWWPAAGSPILSDSALAEWPAFLRQALSPRRVARVHRVTVPDNYALERLARVVVGAVEGERNSLTFWAACRAGEMVASGLLDADLAVELIARAATKSGLSAAEAERTAWSGIRTTAGGRHG